MRLPPLPAKDISFIDEGSLLQESRFIASAASSVIGRAGLQWPAGSDPLFLHVPDAEWPTRWGSVRGESPVTLRPVHTILVALAMLVAGERPVAGQMVSAFLGIASVAMAFAIGRRLFGLPAALLAAAALAVSGWHAIYSTQALAESDSLLFVTIAVWLFIRKPERRLLWTGVALGVAFLANARMWVVLPLLGAADILLRRPSRSNLLATGRQFLGGFAIPVALVIAITQLASIAVQNAPHRQYLARQIETVFKWSLYLFGNPEPLWGTPALTQAPLVDGLSLYPFLTWAWDGPLLVTLLGIGLLGALWRRQPADLLVAGLFIGGYLAQTVLTSNSARFFAVLALPAALLAGRSILLLPRRWHAPATAALLVALLLEGTPRAASLASVPSGYRAAAAFVVQHSGGKHLSNQPPNTGFYTGAANARWLFEDFDDVRRSVAEGYYLAVVALRPALSAAVPWGDRPEVAMLQPLARFPNPYGDSLQSIMEQHTIAPSSRLRDRWQSSNPEILVYDLRPLLPFLARELTATVAARPHELPRGTRR